jgi:hypothetical protein
MRRTSAFFSLGAALFAVFSLACDNAKTSPAPAEPASAAATPKPHVDGSNYTIDTKVADCASGAECSATIRLVALGGYHINDTYPYKFTVDPADVASPRLEFLGKDPQSRGLFGKDQGDFEKDGEKAAGGHVRIKARAAGQVAVAGKYKLSVCSEANCELEHADLAFEGTVK